jgi:nucleoside-diphosphate-sugar epimerase
MKTLVTGGLGYIGSQLLLEAVKEERELRVLDDLSNAKLTSLFNLPNALEIMEGSVCDERAVEKAVHGVDCIIHLAALTGATDSFSKPKQFEDVNLNGTRTLFNAARNAGVKKIVYASSCNIYGMQNEKSLKEDAKIEPKNPYAESKYKAERFLVEACEEAGIKLACLRMSTNYGYSPGIRFNLVINRFAYLAATGQTLTIYGDGENWRPYLHVSDAARAFLFAADELSGVYNAGYAEGNLTVMQVVEEIKKIKECEIEFVDGDAGYSYNVCFDKIKEAGFQAKVKLNNGIRGLIERFNAK